MNIHDTSTVVIVLIVLLAVVGWIYARICRALARSQGFSVSGTVALAVVIVGLFYLWLGLTGFAVLLALIPAWLLERRRFIIHTRHHDDAA